MAACGGVWRRVAACGGIVCCGRVGLQCTQYASEFALHLGPEAERRVRSADGAAGDGPPAVACTHAKRAHAWHSVNISLQASCGLGCDRACLWREFGALRVQPAASRRAARAQRRWRRRMAHQPSPVPSSSATRFLGMREGGRKRGPSPVTCAHILHEPVASARARMSMGTWDQRETSSKGSATARTSSRRRGSSACERGSVRSERDCSAVPRRRLDDATIVF